MFGRRYATLWLALAMAWTAGAASLAFPGAEGFGRFASGGRGGEFYHVTTLADSGPGSLRDAVSRGHRVVVFDVSGYIALESILHVGSDLTIAGQTAPGDGTATRNYEVSFAGVSNVVVRYIRFRQGVTPGQDKKSAVNVIHSRDLIFDHVSIEWGRWDTVDMNDSVNVTLQNCIIGEGVAPQRFGCLCQCDNVTFSHNLFINNQSRNPKAKGKIQYVNNVVYNWGVVGLVGGHSETNHFLDVIGNYFIQGASSSGRFLGEFKPTDRVFQSGNYADLNKDGRLNGRPVVADDFGAGENAATLLAASAIGATANVTVEPAAAAYSNVVAHAGCSLHRDAVDRRLIADVQSLGPRGTTIRDPEEAGGFGDLKEIHAAPRSFAGDDF
jgi:pectate lyase